MSIHGHSWWVTVTIEGEAIDDEGILVEFGAFKQAWRGWLDANIDHHLVLREGDPMAAAVLGVYPESRLLVLPQNPTTEYLARFLFEVSEEVLSGVKREGVEARIRRVHIQETRVNAATYTR